MHLFLNANACNVLCCVAIMVKASKGWISELDARFGGPQLMLNCIIKLGWFLYFFHKLHKGTLIKMATTWEIFGNTCSVFTTCVSFHSIILPKKQQPIFEKNPKKRGKKKRKLVSTYAGLAEGAQTNGEFSLLCLEQSLFSELRWVFHVIKKGGFVHANYFFIL